MNLLKTISMKLTVNLVNMFFHVDEDGAAFPLYTEAVKFIAHKCDALTSHVFPPRDSAGDASYSPKSCLSHPTDCAGCMHLQCLDCA